MYKQHHILILFFSIALFIPIYSEYSTAKMTFSSGYGHDSRNCKEPKSHHNYAHHDIWNNSRVGSSYSKPYHFKQYTANDFRNHCNDYGYTEKEILNQRCLYMFDEFVKFAQTFSSYKCTIQQLHAELKNLNIIQKAYRVATGTHCWGLEKRIHYLYDQLKTVKDIQQNNNIINSKTIRSLSQEQHYEKPISKAYCNKLSDNQIAEYKALDSTYHAYMPSLSNALEQRVDAHNRMMDADSALKYVSKAYNLNNNVKQLLNKYDHDSTRFTKCYGNQLDHAIHQESLHLLERIDNLPSNSVLYDHQEALVDFTVAMVDYNHEGLTDKAINIADLCWTLLDYGQAIAEGAAIGAYCAVTDILHHPIEATINIVAGKQVLAYQLSKVLYNVADISVTALTNFDHAKDKWNKYTEPLNNIIDAISKKEITVRDVLKGGTAFVVGYKTQGKLLGGLGKFCNTVKQKSINFIKNSSVCNPQEYLATPEGLLFKATVNSNKLKQNGQNAGSNLKNSVENKVTPNKSIKRLIKQEKLPTKGKLRYVPPKKLHSFDRLPYEKLSNGDIGFIDRFGNLWVQGKSRTKGQPFEWDVQLSKRGIQQVGWMTRDNTHLNVSLDGRVTHK